MKNNRVEIANEIPELKDHEVNRFKDFDGLMNQYNDYRGTLVRNRIIGGSLSVIAVICLLGLYFYSPGDVREIKHHPPGREAGESVATDSGFVGPVPDSQLAWLELSDRAEPVTRAEVDESVTNKKDQVNKQEIKQEAVQSTPPAAEERPTESTVNTFTDATPVHGMQQLYASLYENIVYPEELRKDSVEGVVMVQFTVERDSSISDILVLQSLGHQFDQEAVRLIRNMPPWKPATRYGSPVSQRFALPVRFSIKKKGEL